MDTEIMMTIGEMAQKYNTTIQTIRWYERELELDIPRNELGQRIYGKHEDELFNKIFYLKEQGLNLKAIKKILENNNIIIEGETGTDPTDGKNSDNTDSNSKELTLYNNFISYMEDFRRQILDDIKHENQQNSNNIIDYINDIKEEIAVTNQDLSNVDRFIEEWRQKQKKPKKSIFARIFSR